MFFFTLYNYIKYVVYLFGAILLIIIYYGGLGGIIAVLWSLLLAWLMSYDSYGIKPNLNKNIAWDNVTWDKNIDIVI